MPDLQSFPTRRSSDLLQLLGPWREMVSLGLTTWAEQPEPTRSEDRKSTRLNSSHITISYAVFCLKKKKTTSEPRWYTGVATSTIPHAALTLARTGSPP